MRSTPEQPVVEGTRVSIPFLDCGPEIVLALSTGSSAFQDVVLAYFAGREPQPGMPTLPGVTAEDRQKLREQFPVLVHNFEEHHGTLVRSYFSNNCLAAAALTSADEIEVVLAQDVPSSELIQIIRRAQALGFSAWHRLEDYDRRLCQRMVFSVILEVLRRLDQARMAHGHNGRREMSAADVAHLRQNLDDAEDFMLRCATRRAQTDYVNGMLRLGSLPFVALVALAIVVRAFAGDFESLLGQGLLVAVAGAAGAMVSVMWRMTSGTFSINLPTLDYDTGSSQLTLMGALRPVIGAVFAVAVFVFIKSPLVPLEDASRDDTFLLVALGFLAGFSERFAQDMFVRSGQGLAGPGGDAPSTGLSAGLAPPPGVRGGRRRRATS